MKKITYTVKETIESMLLAGKVGCDIAYELGVSQSMVSKVRKEIMKKNPEKEVLWHSGRGGAISNWGW